MDDSFDCPHCRAMVFLDEVTCPACRGRLRYRTLNEIRWGVDLFDLVPGMRALPLLVKFPLFLGAVYGLGLVVPPWLRALVVVEALFLLIGLPIIVFSRPWVEQFFEEMNGHH